MIGPMRCPCRKVLLGLCGLFVTSFVILTGHKAIQLWPRMSTKMAPVQTEPTVAFQRVDRSHAPETSTEYQRVHEHLPPVDRGAGYEVSLVCPQHFELLRGNLTVNLSHAVATYWRLSNFSAEEDNSSSSEVILGKPVEKAVSNPPVAALFGPANCEASQTVAIIIPFRYREEHLRILLGHLIPVLQRQLVRYAVFVISQKEDGLFNKGRLMNTGFQYALEAGKGANQSFDCYIFHDVDLLVERDTLLYRCPKGENVTHLSSSVDKFDYKPLCCGMTVGGVLGFTEEQFKKVNGYPNLYWGWGGEDDDMDKRISHRKLKITRDKGINGRYIMIKHGPDKNNPWTKKVLVLLKSAKGRFDTDGLSNLDTRIVAVERFPLFMKIEVDVEDKP